MATKGLFTNIIIAIIIVNVFALTFSAMASKMAESYGTTIDAGFINKYNQIENSTSIVNNANNQVQGITQAIIGDTATNLLNKGISAFQFLTGGVSILTTMLTEAVQVLVLPEYYIAAISAILTVTLLSLSIAIYYRSFYTP